VPKGTKSKHFASAQQIPVDALETRVPDTEFFNIEKGPSVTLLLVVSKWVPDASTA
jgi:hypothetical protein